MGFVTSKIISESKIQISGVNKNHLGQVETINGAEPMGTYRRHFSTQQNFGTQLLREGCAGEEMLLQEAPPPSLHRCCPGLLPGHSCVDIPTSLVDITVGAQKSQPLPAGGALAFPELLFDLM